MKIINVQQGFTLMELMITVAIIGILTAIAYPNYTAYVQKSRRADAQVALNEIVQRQENYFLRNFSYANSLNQLGYVNTSPEGYYSLAMATVTPAACDGSNSNRCESYSVTATPVVGNVQAADNECQSFSLDNRGSRQAKNKDGNSSEQCWR